MLDVAKSAIPFDTKQLDRLMDEAGIDVLLANSKHNIQYLLGGHRSIFFDYMDAMGISRYLPILVYAKGAPEKAAFFGHRLESHQKEVNPFWTPEGNTNSGGSVDAMQQAVDYVRRAGIKSGKIGAELAFLPVDSWNVLRNAFPHGEIVDAVVVLERQRAVKSPAELQKLRKASEGVIESISPTSLDLTAPYAGRLTIPRNRLARLDVIGRATRLIIDPTPHHLGNSVVAVDIQTGKYKWHFQTIHHDLWDASATM